MRFSISAAHIILIVSDSDH